ncbi:MAG: class I SAM-dependent methyltransferase [Acidobacteria bacterium]|nr:class I SAM-dependent methyltransferase [Acidobacteriota bacterium]
MAARRKKEWFDDDAFWRELYPFLFTRERLAAADDHVEQALALARPRGHAALDLACGPGRCSVALARRGFTVTGVDRTRLLLDRARSRARRAGVPVEWVRADMRDFVRAEAFDLALSMFTSFGYFDEKDDDVLVLRNVLASLKPGGVFLMELVGKEFLAGVFQPTTMDTRPDGSRLVQSHEILDDWTRIRNEWVLVRRGRTRTFRFHHTIYSGQELKDRLLAAGFVRIRLYGSLGGAPYGRESERLVAVAHKPGARGGRPR